MADDYEAAAAAARECVFLAAGAILSRGQQIGVADLDHLRAAMVVEATPPDLVEEICRRASVGIQVAEVPCLGHLSEEQTGLFAAAITLFALRATRFGDPLECARSLCFPYRVDPAFIDAFARELAECMETRHRDDTEANLRDLLEPPDALVKALHRFQVRKRTNRKPRRSVASVSPSRIQHPGDREATGMLEGATDFKTVVNHLMKHALEKLQRVNNIGSRIRVGPNQLPGLYRIFQDCVARSGVAPEPELYLESGSINAFTYGTDRPFIVLQSGAITLLTTTELEFILGHELGHIRFQHVLNHTLASYLPDLARLLPFGDQIAQALNFPLYKWYRMAELSADRMGLLVCQDTDAALQVMVKLSGLPAALYSSVNLEAFLAQYDEYKAMDGEVGGTVAKLIQTAELTHPWAVVRAHEIKSWAENGDYSRFLEGLPLAVGGEITQRSRAKLLPYECVVCGEVVPAEQRKCSKCASPVTERNRFRPCIRCGIAGRPSHAFCESCGAPQDRPARENS